MKTAMIAFFFATLTILGCSSGTVTSVKVEAIRDSAATGPNIDKSTYDNPDIAFPGSTLKYKATVEGTGNFDSAVVWSLKNPAFKAKISEDGVLSISPEQDPDIFYVTATSKQNPKVSGIYSVTIIYDANAFKGKWVRKWKKYQDTIHIEDNSVAVRLSNGKSYSFKGTKWESYNNDESLTKDDFPGGFAIYGLMDKAKVNIMDTASFPQDYELTEIGQKTGLNLFINKEKTKLCRMGLDRFAIYEKVK